IIDALSRSVPCETVDGVKKRCRPGMGRCQGGFCGPNVAKIISEQKGIPLEEVCKADKESRILFGKSKGGDRND
ncbi:MAG: (2Fe-2S)-binding protein, partial [Oscillospiraceae bacterium]